MYIMHRIQLENIHSTDENAKLAKTFYNPKNFNTLYYIYMHSSLELQTISSCKGNSQNES